MNAALASDVLPFLTAAFENAAVTGCLLAKSRQVWPVSRIFGFFTRKKMTRVFAYVFAALMVLGVGQAQAQEGDSRNQFLGGPNLFSGGSSPIPRTTVSYAGEYAPGTIVVNTAERRLYLVLPNGQALRYGIGVGRDGFRWGGTHRITAKKEWPSWTPPSQMLARRPDLPRHMNGGIDNPLGARAMYLGSTLYRIHGSNEPETIGQAVSSGCFRMTNDDVTDLYGRVSVGTTVVVKNN
jgi:lipoprotein-anchoring transpeptidase ErfK/SrfK